MVTQGVELPVSPSVLLARCSDEAGVFALDGGSEQSWGSGRALFGFRPRATLRVMANGDARMCTGDTQRRWRGDPFDLLDRFCAQWNDAAGTAAEHCAGGVVATLSYDLRHWVEPLRTRRREDGVLPVLYAAFYDWLLSYSYAERRYQLASLDRSRSQLSCIAAQLNALSATPAPAARCAAPPRVVADMREDEYLQAARTALDYIAAGDAYQVNLAQRFVVDGAPAPAAVFAALQQQHPVPFGAYVDAGDFTLVSNSPECFLTVRDRSIATFPIKGTRPRGADARSDDALARELHSDAKERAEHVMIVDLERNDLGRLCCTGSVRVKEFARVQTFPSLHHMISTITGRLRRGTPLADVLRATFPGGSITGAPKIRAMEIIDEIEPVSRGFYTGAIGFIGLDGSAVFNIAIRTAVATPTMLTYHAGGGIVADSVPRREYDETLLKARAFFAALQ